MGRLLLLVFPVHLAGLSPLQVPCKILAILLHFFFLSTFAWMLVEGFHLYSMVIKVFGSEENKLLYYYGIGWGKSGLVFPLKGGGEETLMMTSQA